MKKRRKQKPKITDTDRLTWLLKSKYTLVSYHVNRNGSWFINSIRFRSDIDKAIRASKGGK